MTAADAGFADAAATLACNLVRAPSDIDPVLDRISRLRPGTGVLLVKDDRIGLAGALPQLVRNRDKHTEQKITRHRPIR